MREGGRSERAGGTKEVGNFDFLFLSITWLSPALFHEILSSQEVQEQGEKPERLYPRSRNQRRS